MSRYQSIKGIQSASLLKVYFENIFVGFGCLSEGRIAWSQNSCSQPSTANEL